jgi:hypothetical protein
VRGFRNFVIESVIRPPVLLVGFVIGKLYWLLIGWWYEKRVARSQERALLDSVMDKMRFLFSGHGARVVANGDVGALAKLGAAIVTVSAEGLRFRFIEHRGDRQVHVTSDNQPYKWYELSSVLNAIDPKRYQRHSVTFFEDAARVLQERLDTLKEALSSDRRDSIERATAEAHRDEMLSTLEIQQQINLRLRNR